MLTKRTFKKSRMDKQHGKIIRRNPRRTEGENILRFTQNDTQKSTKLKNPRPWILVYKLSSIHERVAIEMNRCLQETDISEWMTKEDPLIQKDPPQKGTALNNYRPITYQLIMWKILTVQIWEEIYNLLIGRGLFPKERKVQENYYILINTSTRRARREGKNLAMAWIDYKAGPGHIPICTGPVPQSWLIDRLKIYKISGEVIKFIENTMDNWRVELTGGGKSLTAVKIQRGIISIAYLGNDRVDKNFISRKKKINQLMYMNDINCL